MKTYLRSTLITVQNDTITRYLEVDNEIPTRQIKTKNGRTQHKSEVAREQVGFFRMEKDWFKDWVVITAKEFQDVWNG